MKTSYEPVVIIGAGLSGLSAALELEAAGESCLILEASDHIGGKVETTNFKDRYLLDRGFQVLLPSYPELKRLGNLDQELSLKYFNSGARLETDNKTITIANPLNHPFRIFSTLFGRYATLNDKILVMKLQFEVMSGDPSALLNHPNQTTLEYLRSFGFSQKIITTFWQPFFSGIFLENHLETAAGFFRYLVRMFASSPVAVPKLGMGELPKLLSRRLQNSEIRLQSEVKNQTATSVELMDGSKISARAVVDSKSLRAGPFGAVTTFWFSAPEPPFGGAWLSLNSRPNSMINHVAVLSNVSKDYAPKGDALISINVVKPETSINIKSLIAQAREIYGSNVDSWNHLRTDQISNAFPLYLNRTDQDTPSQQGAMLRGRNLGRLVLDKL